MTEVPSLKERQVSRLIAQNPVKTMTCRRQHPGSGSIPNKRTDRSPGPPDWRIADATAGPSLCAPKIFGAGGALPRDISLSGENETHPAPHFAVFADCPRAIREVVKHYSGAAEIIASPFRSISDGSVRRTRGGGHRQAEAPAGRGGWPRLELLRLGCRGLVPHLRGDDALAGAAVQSTAAPLRHLTIFATTPAPTVRPPSRIAKRRPSSIATGLISCTAIFTLSPGITISVPSGSVTAPVMSVVRK